MTHNAQVISQAMMAAFRRQLGSCHVQQFWIEDDGRVRFRLDDGRVGDVEVLVNFDVVSFPPTMA